MRMEQLDGHVAMAGPCTLVLFGASGDLVKRKLIPALYNLVREKLLPEEFAIVGFARRDTSSQDFRDQVRRNLQAYATDGFSESDWDWLEKRFFFVPGAFEDEEAYAQLDQKLSEVEATWHTGGNVLFYLAASPEYFGTIVEKLAKAGMVKQTNGKWPRVVV